MDEKDGGEATTLGQIVFDKNHAERPPWKILGLNCPRSALVFFIQSFLLLILVITSITSIILAKTCEETTVWVAILSSSVGYFLPSPKL